jgi:hypothetical protein
MGHVKKQENTTHKEDINQPTITKAPLHVIEEPRHLLSRPIADKESNRRH